MITKEQAEQVFSRIHDASNILLHCHPNPDGDSLGSSLAMYHVLRGMGKKVTLIKGDSDLPRYLSFLPGYDSVEKKNYFEVDIAKYDLFLILDAAALGQISRVGEIKFPPTLKTVVIDHHISNTGFADINIIDAAYPATAQMVYDLLELESIDLTKDIATCLFIGIYTDTGGFRYLGTSEATFTAVASLVAHVPDFTKLIFGLDNSNTEGRVRLEALMLNSVEIWFGKVAVASATYKDMEERGINKEDMAGNDTAGRLKSVIGWDIGLSLIEQEPNSVKISFRTRDSNKYDLSKVASYLGGGGHKAAAGGRVDGSINETKAKIKEALKSVFPDLK